LLDKHLRLAPGANDPNFTSRLGDDPKFQWSLRSSHRLSDTTELEIALRRVGALPQPAVEAYTAVDMRAAWRIAPTLDLSLTIRNAFDPNHVEYRIDPYTSQIPRSVLL